MSRFEQIRHRPPAASSESSELVLVCAPLRSNVNLSRILRTAGCCGLRRVVACGRPKVDPQIARDAAEFVQLEVHRTLEPVLRRLREEGFRLVGLEQTTRSQTLYDYRFAPRSALVAGNERRGLDQEILDLLDDVVEIPVYGRPASYNVAASVDMALYEFRRQQARPIEGRNRP